MNNYEVIGGCYSPRLNTFLDLYYFSHRSKPYSVTATIPDKTTWESFPHHVHFPTQQKYFRNDAFAERKSLPQFNVASYKHPGIRLPFEYITTLLSGEGGEGRTGTATIFRKMLSKYTIFSTVLSKIVYKVIRVFSQEYLQGQNKNMLIKSTLQKLFWAQSFTPDHLLIEKQDLIYVFCSTLFKTVRFRNIRTTRATCSCSSRMEGSENVKSNLSFSEESEQDLYDGSLRRLSLIHIWRCRRRG